MSNFLISSYSLSSAPRSAVMRAQNELRIAQKEVVTGRFADVGLSLGVSTSRSISLRGEMESVDRQRQANTVVGNRFDLMQSALTAIADTGESLRASLIASSGNAQAVAVAISEAGSSLDQLMSGLNVNSGSRFLFSGAATDRPALSFVDAGGEAVAGYAKGSTAQAATRTAFETFLAGRSPDEVTAGELEEFLDGDFAALFADPPAGGWSNFSGVADVPVTNRVGDGESLDVAANASNQAFRNIAEAYVMLSDLGTRGLNEDARQLLTRRASETLGTGLSQLTDIRGDIGFGQARLDQANERLEVRKSVLTVSIDELEGVDAYEASTRITNLTNLLESSYALTARLSRLSILNYL